MLSFTDQCKPGDKSMHIVNYVKKLNTLVSYCNLYLLESDYTVCLKYAVVTFALFSVQQLSYYSAFYI